MAVGKKNKKPHEVTPVLINSKKLKELKDKKKKK